MSGREPLSLAQIQQMTRMSPLPKSISHTACLVTPRKRAGSEPRPASAWPRLNAAYPHTVAQRGDQATARPAPQAPPCLCARAPALGQRGTGCEEKVFGSPNNDDVRTGLRSAHQGGVTGWCQQAGGRSYHL
jgi:hypothetical protein